MLVDTATAFKEGNNYCGGQTIFFTILNIVYAIISPDVIKTEEA